MCFPVLVLQHSMVRHSDRVTCLTSLSWWLAVLNPQPCSPKSDVLPIELFRLDRKLQIKYVCLLFSSREKQNRPNFIHPFKGNRNKIS